jgi:very-short-patch-repair endonuclease
MDGIAPECWAAGPTAAALHRFDGYRLRKPFHLIVRRGGNITRIGHVIHTSNELELIDLERVGGIPVLSPSRTLLSLAALHSTSAFAPFATLTMLTDALDSAIRDGKTTEDNLHRRIARLRVQGRGGIRPLLAVIAGVEITRGGHSWLEREFLRLVDSAGLPKPATQQVLGRRGKSLIRVDFRFDGTPIVVEVLGYQYHRTKLQARIDAERRNRLQLDGYQVIEFVYEQVVDDPGEVLATLIEALRPYLAALCTVVVTT